jgi:ribosomal protein S18 acetylase RimI-like enzyme
MTVAGGLLRRLEAQLHEALAEGTEVVEVHGFKIHIWRTPDPFYRNVAVPVRPASDWPAAIAALRESFARHERRARVEFFAELWPELEAALEAAGFGVEARAPVMTAQRPVAGAADPGPSVELLDASTPPEVLRACLEGAAAAFHEPTAILAPGELERLQDGLARGTLRSAVVRVKGAPVCGASLAGRGAVAELLGVWTHPSYRRRGLARATCRHLLRDFFAGEGRTAWLTAASAAGAGLYRELGFSTCGTHLDYADELEHAAHPADS